MSAFIMDGIDTTQLSTEQQQFVMHLHDTVTGILEDKNISYDFMRLKDKKIAWCNGCFGCWYKTPGKCLQEDDAWDIAKKMVIHDSTITLTPVTFGGYSSVLKQAFDRQICLISPYFENIGGEIHHRKRYDTDHSLLNIGYLEQPHPGMEETFKRLTQRNCINMHISSFDSCVVHATEEPNIIQQKIFTSINRLEVL